MLIESIFTQKSPSLKDCPLSALFILPVPVLLALMVLGFWGKLWEGTGACRAGLWEEPWQLRWRRKASAFWAQRNGPPSLLLLSVFTRLEARTPLNSREISNQPPGLCRASPASPWLRYPSCAEQNLPSSQLVRLRAVSGTALHNTDAWFPL